MKSIPNIVRPKVLSFLFVAVFGGIYGLISFVNHACFRTAYYDLGLYTHALYRYFHLEGALFATGDHLDFLLVLASPLILIFGTYSLLILQIAAVLWGGVGIRQYLASYGARFATYGQLHFYLFFGVFTAISFDYHSNVVAAALVPHLLLCMREKQYPRTVGYLLLILISKENMSLWMSFVLSGYFAHAYFHEKWADKRQMIYLMLLTIVSFSYFLIAWKILLPLFQQGESYTILNYEVLQRWDIMNIFSALFTNHTHAAHGDYVKIELYLCLFVSGGIFLLRKPAYLWMLVPIIAQKSLHNAPNFWGVGFHYSIEFAPILTLAAFEEIASWKNTLAQKIVLNALVLSTAAATFYVCDNPIGYVDRDAIRFYQKNHYVRRDISIRDIRYMISQIPDTGAVSAQGAFTPHLALRKNCYQYPYIAPNTRYILISNPVTNPYPVTEARWAFLYDSIRISPTWKMRAAQGNLFLWERVKPD